MKSLRLSRLVVVAACVTGLHTAAAGNAGRPQNPGSVTDYPPIAAQSCGTDRQAQSDLQVMVMLHQLDAGRLMSRALVAPADPTIRDQRREGT